MSNDLNLPWWFFSYETLDGSYADVLDCDDAIIAECLSPEKAAHIVRCVNSHDALVEALQNLTRDCMASDFNECWESFKEAELLLVAITKL